MNGRRLLFGVSRPDTHRGWLARHGGRGTSRASVVETKPGADGSWPEFPFSLRLDPSMSDDVEARAVAVLARAARFASRPIVYARVAIRSEHDRSVARPVTVTASLHVSGRIVTVRASARSPLDALDVVERRLRRSLDRIEARRRARRRST